MAMGRVLVSSGLRGRRESWLRDLNVPAYCSSLG